NYSDVAPPTYLARIYLKILAAALIVASLVVASLWLLAIRFSVRRASFLQCTWTVLAMVGVTMAAWFITSAAHYQVPIFHRQVTAPLVIVHVQKRGLHFNSKSITVARDGRVYVVRTSRRLFQYSFAVHLSIASAENVNAYVSARTLAESPQLWNQRAPALGPL